MLITRSGAQRVMKLGGLPKIISNMEAFGDTDTHTLSHTHTI